MFNAYICPHVAIVSMYLEFLTFFLPGLWSFLSDPSLSTGFPYCPVFHPVYACVRCAYTQDRYSCEGRAFARGSDREGRERRARDHEPRFNGTLLALWLRYLYAGQLPSFMDPWNARESSPDVIIMSRVRLPASAREPERFQVFEADERSNYVWLCENIIHTLATSSSSFVFFFPNFLPERYPAFHSNETPGLFLEHDTRSRWNL